MTSDRSPADRFIASAEKRMQATGREVSLLVELRLREIVAELKRHDAFVIEYLHTGMGAWSVDGRPYVADYTYEDDKLDCETDDVWDWLYEPRRYWYEIPGVGVQEKGLLREFYDLADWWLDAGFVELRDVDFTKPMRDRADAAS